MALTTITLTALSKLIKPGNKIASMGYPDLICHMKIIEQILGAKIYSLQYREDSDSVSSWHLGEKRKIPDARSFFSLLGVSLTVYDVAEIRGGEVIRDLNLPLPAEDLGQYDIVCDVGTLEHCFNIGQAAINMAGLLKQGGVILHENPYNCGNHGFYNLNPTWYSDFYGQPGFKLKDVMMIASSGAQVQGVMKTSRFIYTEMEANMFACAERTEIRPIVFPIQSKYRKMIPAAVAA